MPIMKFVLLFLLVCQFENLANAASYDRDHDLSGTRGTEGQKVVSSANKSRDPDAPLLMHCNVTGETHQAAF